MATVSILCMTIYIATALVLLVTEDFYPSLERKVESWFPSFPHDYRGLPVLNNYYKSAACFLKEGDTVRIQVPELVSPEVWYVTLVEHTEPERQQELKDEMSRCYGEKEERMSYRCVLFRFPWPKQ